MLTGEVSKRKMLLTPGLAYGLNSQTYLIFDINYKKTLKDHSIHPNFGIGYLPKLNWIIYSNIAGIIEKNKRSICAGFGTRYKLQRINFFVNFDNREDSLEVNFLNEILFGFEFKNYRINLSASINITNLLNSCEIPWKFYRLSISHTKTYKNGQMESYVSLGGEYTSSRTCPQYFILYRLRILDFYYYSKLYVRDLGTYSLYEIWNTYSIALPNLETNFIAGIVWYFYD